MFLTFRIDGGEVDSWLGAAAEALFGGKTKVATTNITRTTIGQADPFLRIIKQHVLLPMDCLCWLWSELH